MPKLDEIRSRPATLVFNSRIDARHLATILLFWHSKNDKPSSVSELARLSLEAFADLLVTNGLAEFVQTQDEAFEVIKRAGLLNKKMSSMNLRNRMNAIIEEGGAPLNLSSLAGISPKAAVIKKSAPKHGDPTFNAALAALESNMGEDVDSRVKKAQANTDDFRKSMGIIKREEVNE